MCHILAGVPHRFIDHTADVAVEIRAPTRDALFADALAAFTDTVTDPAEIHPDLTIRLEVAADDAEGLMIEWLGELVYRFDVDGLLFSAARVEIEDVTTPTSRGLRLIADARGETYDEARHPLKVQVKGVTYHDLEVRRDAGGGWLARVIFDI